MSTHLRNDQRSLALHEEAVRVLREHPEKAAVALEVLTRWQSAGDVHTMPLWNEWRRIIEGALWEIAVEDSDRGQQLRQASPLGFVLTPEQRNAISARFRRDGAKDAGG
jgi:hypothetical protein